MVDASQASHPDQGEVVKALARLYHRGQQAQRATDTLSTFIARYPAQARLPASLEQRRALVHANTARPALRADGSDPRQHPGGAVCRGGAVAQGAGPDSRCRAATDGRGRGGDPSGPAGGCAHNPLGVQALLISTPASPTLQVKAGAALAHLGRIDEAVETFGALFAEPVDAFQDLYLDAGATLMEVQQPGRALPFFKCASGPCCARTGRAPPTHLAQLPHQGCCGVR